MHMLCIAPTPQFKKKLDLSKFLDLVSLFHFFSPDPNSNFPFRFNNFSDIQPSAILLQKDHLDLKVLLRCVEFNTSVSW